ncbi:hypothetical protein [Paenibacillus mucilaginosus]|uniref:Uncharacterized protein n=3 Tax=Paenibacillus mucilaginosus TaxID=61624 RepID=H6NEV3_9BACL|nr:hypothetical protein [Paenibacillus mucilaginosus]AEI39979.1 hypothetical protein KNP414_01415 [Paenibacillus mucilaginosus KNP414]AFC28644.1 hypothetical protein PM3016_1732 [Paenibacillus mucilaginosus 3016]AFH60818.1 hypothetical protein B2K_08820 [Paenibacillus mucilaginosus K02]MCG7216401.1 hypothetical protein [Paenibacillus mucilaginosus]WDM29235.1 hypothetical protein KCX80_08800 [Paenibacillus mucilaginosus]
MPSEYDAALCFVRTPDREGRPLQEELAADLHGIFPGASLDLEPKSEDGFEIVVARMNGLGPWGSEEELLGRMEREMPESWWTWLAGYRLLVTPKEDAGPCRLKNNRKEARTHECQ